MIRIICLVRYLPPLIYFVNRINEAYKVSLVIVESKPVYKKLINEIKLEGILGGAETIRKKAFNKIREKVYENDYNKYFGDKWGSINKNIPILRVEDFNSQVVYERIKEEHPDLILDHGTSIVKDRILEIADLNINLHWGLSPYYRGTHCTEWALINWDPYNIGVTIHKLTKIIDGGSILVQKRAIIQSNDTVNSINMQLTQLGTELVIKAIDKIKLGEQLQFKKQNYSLGSLTLECQWDKFLDKRMENIENNNLIKLMLEKPARKQRLLIVEW